MTIHWLATLVSNTLISQRNVKLLLSIHRNITWNRRTCLDCWKACTWSHRTQLSAL